MDEHPKTIMIGFAPADFLTSVAAPALIESIKNRGILQYLILLKKQKIKELQELMSFY